MPFNTKNYNENGDKLVIGGALEILEGASVKGISSNPLPTIENQVDSTATTIADLKADFNSLLSKLKAAGLMEADS